MVNEILGAMGHEATGAPWTLVLEVVQFLILVAIGWLLAVGTPKRPGILKKRLVGRREAVVHDVEDAMGADDRAEAARAQAREIAKAARRQARTIKAAATREANRLEGEVRASADAEAERIARRVEEALDSEASASRQELREELVEVVAQGTRSVLSTSLSLPQQRDLIERAVLGATQTAPDTAQVATPPVPASAVAAAATGAP